MFLDNLNNRDGSEALMSNHRRLFAKFKTLVSQRKFDDIEVREVNQEKEMVIRHMNNAEN